MSLNALLIFLILRYIARHRWGDGHVLWTFLILYPLGRSIIEIFRGDIIRGFVIPGVLSTSQALSIPVAIVGMVMLYRLYRWSHPSDEAPNQAETEAPASA